MNIKIENECEPCSYRAGAAARSVNHVGYPSAMCFPLFSGDRQQNSDCIRSLGECTPAVMNLRAT